MADDNNVEIGIGINPTGAETGARRVKSAVGGVVSDANQMGAAFRRLKAAIDPAFGATEKYNKAMAEYDQLLKEGKILQEDYARQTDLIKRAFDAQISSIERNSAAAKQAAADKKTALLKEAQDREESARAAKATADEWLAHEKANSLALKQELEARTIAEKRQIAEAAAAAKAAAAEKAAEIRAGGGTLTKNAEMTMIREAAAAAKLAARERLAVEHEVNDEIKQSYAQTYAAAKILAQEASDAATLAARERQAAETAVIEAIGEVDKAQKKEAADAARQATAAAILAGKERAAAEAEAENAAKKSTRATEEAARAAKREADAVAELRASINPAFAAQERYNNTMRTATQLLMANLLKEGEWIAVQKQAKIQMDINTRSLGRMNQVGVQLGYQMQDVTASIASGISPLTIFAQQSGQVAYAMQGMGGAAGKVADIMGGVYFQAITAVILVLGMLWKSTDEGKKKTADLSDAEWRRTATLKDLTEALDEYIKKQKEANTTANETLRKNAENMANDRREMEMKLAKAKADLDEAERAAANWQGEAQHASATVALENQIKEVQRLEAAVKKATDAEVEARASFAQGLGKQTALETAQQAAEEKAYQEFKRQNADQRLTFEQRNALMDQYRQKVNAIAEEFKRRKDEEAQSRRENISLMKTENALYQMPVEGPIKSGFGSRNAPLKPDGTYGSSNHKGIDIAVPVGTPVKAPQVGTVEVIGQDRTSGKYVILNHGGGTTSRYLHLSDNSMVQKGQTVQQGEVFAKSGNTGGVAPHLHYGVYVNGKPVDPRKGIFPIDTIKAEQAGMKDLETAAQKAAKAAVAAIELQEAAIDHDDTLNSSEKLQKVAKLEDDRIKIIEKAYGKQSKEAEDAKKHELDTIEKYNKLILQAETKRIKQEEQLATIKEKGSEAGDTSQLAIKSSKVDFLAQEGLVNDRQALSMKAQILDEEYAMQQRHEEAMWQMQKSYMEMEMNAPGQDKDRRDQIHNEIEIAEAEHLDRMAQMKLKYGETVNNVELQSASLTIGKYKDMSTAITGSLRSSLQGIWTHTQTIQGLMINMADAIVYKFFDMGVQMVNDWIMNQVRMRLFKKTNDTVMLASSRTTAAVEQGIQAATTGAAVTAQAIKTGAAVTGAATQTGVAASAGMSEITTNAAASAAGAYKSTVVIPFIGPVAAPAAAAMALAAVLGFGALISAKGGLDEVPSDQMAMVHKKEMILPAWIAEPMRQQLKGGARSAQMFGATAAAGTSARESMAGGSSGEINFHYGPTHNNHDTDLRSVLRRDAAEMRKWLKNEVRNGNLRLAKV